MKLTTAYGLYVVRTSQVKSYEVEESTRTVWLEFLDSRKYTLSEVTDEAMAYLKDQVAVEEWGS